MIVKAVFIGCGASVGTFSCAAPGSKVEAGAIVEAVASVPAGISAKGHCSGCPIKQIGHADPKRIPTEEDVQHFNQGEFFWRAFWCLLIAPSVILAMAVIVW